MNSNSKNGERQKRQTAKTATAGILFASMAAMAIGATGTAHASPSDVGAGGKYSAQDTAYISALNQDDILTRGAEPELIGLGHKICETRYAGVGSDKIVTIVAKNMSVLTINQVNFLYGAAVGAYCPEMF